LHCHGRIPHIANIVEVFPARENHLPTKQAFFTHSDGSDVLGHDTFLNLFFIKDIRPSSEILIKSAVAA
jgi:hypothetical protein